MIITGNTTWSGNITLTDNVEVAPGVTLTVAPGTTITGGNHYIQAFGQVKLVGTEQHKIQVSDVDFRLSNLQTTKGALNIDFADLKGGTLLPFQLNGSHGSFTLTDSSVIGMKEFIYLLYLGGDTKIERNLFTNSGGISGGTLANSSILIKDNTFVAQTTGYAIESWENGAGSFIVQGNSFLTTSKTALALRAGYDGAKMTAIANYFGTTDVYLIQQMITDKADSLQYASIINYSDYLLQPSSVAPSPTLPTISYKQKISGDNQIMVELYGSDLPVSEATIRLNFSYSANLATFEKVQFSGTSGFSLRESVLGETGKVSIVGLITPSATGPFATIVFDAQNSGTFNVDILTFKLNELPTSYSDPDPFNFTIVPIVEVKGISVGQSVSGEYNPFDSILPSLSVEQQGAHGTVSFWGPFSAYWTYVPSAGFYGQDQFILSSTESGRIKQKIYVVDVSPVGTESNDVFKSSKAAYVVDGGGGLDTMHFSGVKANFAVEKSGNVSNISDKTAMEGTQVLSNFERLKFADSALALDIDGNAGRAYRLYQAAFDRKPDLPGLGVQMNALDVGFTLQQISQNFIDSPEFNLKYGPSLSNEDFVTQLYANVLHRFPDPDGYAHQTKALENGMSRAQLLINFSESPENYKATLVGIENGIEYIPVA